MQQFAPGADLLRAVEEDDLSARKLSRLGAEELSLAPEFLRKLRAEYQTE
jgi:hypothetical protein